MFSVYRFTYFFTAFIHWCYSALHLAWVSCTILSSVWLRNTSMCSMPQIGEWSCMFVSVWNYSPWRVEFIVGKNNLVLLHFHRWGKSGFSYHFSSATPELQSNGYTNGSANDTQRQTSVRRKQQYDGGWVAGKTHQGNYKHR